MRDVTATATANTSARRVAADAAIASDTTGSLSALRDLVRRSTMSTNVSADKLFAYDDGGEVLHTRDAAVRTAGGNEPAGSATFATLQGGWLRRREGFEDLWHHGRRFLYGAVNAGGMGTEGKFGPFCLVVPDPEHSAPDALAVFPGDSASTYTDDTGAVDEVAAAADATAWAARGELAVLERGAEALTSAASSWPEVVCRQDHYLEVVRAGELPVTEVAELRVREAFRRRLDRLQARVVRRDALTPEDANLAAAYDVANGWRRSHGLAITDVPDP